MEMTLDDVDGIVEGHFFVPTGLPGPWDPEGQELPKAAFFMPGYRKKGISAETPQHYHFITAFENSQQIQHRKFWFLCFTPNNRKFFVWFPVLKKALGHGRLMVQKKVIPDMVSAPAGWAFDIFRFT